MNEETKQVLYECIKRYGENSQMCNAMEECAELIQAINKMRRYGIGENKEYLLNLTEEITDVLLFIEQIKTIYSIKDSDIEKVIDYKIRRQIKRFESEDNNDEN